MKDRYTAPRRASIKSVNNYLNRIEAGFFIELDPANGWNITKYEPLENGQGRRLTGRTPYSTPRQFLDAFVAGYEA